MQRDDGQIGADRDAQPAPAAAPGEQEPVGGDEEVLEEGDQIAGTRVISARAGSLAITTIEYSHFDDDTTYCIKCSISSTFVQQAPNTSSTAAAVVPDVNSIATTAMMESSSQRRLVHITRPSLQRNYTTIDAPFTCTCD